MVAIDIRVLATSKQRSNASAADPDVVGDARRGLAWSAYDPTEGRLDSDDPLGFAAAALRLADQILPGLTVRTVDLRYYPMICAGLLAVEEADGDAERRRCFMIWEKLWAIARVSTGQGSGVLGVNGAGRHLASRHRSWLDRRYVLLQRQPFVGALGSYSTSLEALELKRPGSLLLTDAGSDLGMAALKEASSTFARNLLAGVRESIRLERDRVGPSRKWGVSHDKLAAVGRLNPRISATLRDRLFDRLSTRGRATRLVLQAIRDAGLPDLVALRTLAASAKRDPGLAALARHALAIEDVTCAATFALERILGAALANGYVVAADEVPWRDPMWVAAERQLRQAATQAASELSDADLPKEHATAATFAELSGSTLVRELVLHHERVMAGRSARRWASLDADSVHAYRIQPVPSNPEPISHTYRFGSARALARQAGLNA